MLVESTYTQQRVTIVLGIELRAGNSNIRTKNEITKITLVGTTKNERKNMKHESRTNLRGIEMEFTSLTRNKSQTLTELVVAVLRGNKNNFWKALAQRTNIGDKHNTTNDKEIRTNDKQIAIGMSRTSQAMTVATMLVGNPEEAATKVVTTISKQPNILRQRSHNSYDHNGERNKVMTAWRKIKT
ncbi:hypothetical protein DEO72_LG3g1879 [Vigna unguiculata]|uniref:Uncharacterized protein n=1 Tax=Vigna unguiculata TaxID=3917 RepID=A0A4D6LG98_VIGUN|nr:hypothetical protein DEO72_LG3g1879 [Vigna unguiculata]